MTAFELLTRVAAAKIAVFIAVLAVMVLVALVDPTYEPSETL